MMAGIINYENSLFLLFKDDKRYAQGFFNKWWSVNANWVCHLYS